MKNFIILFLSLISFQVLSQTAFPVNINGKIVNVYFKTEVPDVDNNFIYQSGYIEKSEQLQLMNSLYQALLDYNYDTRIEYIPKDIYICTKITDAETKEITYGVNLENGEIIVLNIQNPNIIGSFHHEIFHTIIKKHYEFWPDNFVLLLYRSIRQYTEHGKIESTTYENGYVSSYASTHVVEDLCEMYEDIMIYKLESMMYIKENPNSKLALKFGLLIESLNKNLNFMLTYP